MSSRILVIDDDQSILELFQLILESEEYEVLLSKRAFEEARRVIETTTSTWANA